MCGIIGRLGRTMVVEDLMTGLENLEYRGYDSAGIAVATPDSLVWEKTAGEISDLRSHLGDYDQLDGPVGIGHTRWSTHGLPTDANAHPHTDCQGRVAVVHNGIIDNHDDLRRSLRNAGHQFESETDSEVIAHLVEDRLADGATPTEAVRQSVAELAGSYAIVVIVEGVEALFATRNGSPLVLGIADDGYFLASDVPAFLETTDRVVYLEDGDVAVVEADGYDLTAVDGAVVTRPVETVDWVAEDARKGGHDHFMLKEIREQPTTLSRTIEGRVDARSGEVSLEEFPSGAFDDVSMVHFVGCGTSYHAALFAQTLLLKHGVPAQAFLASEYVPVRTDSRPLVVAVTQSGETADTLTALRAAQRNGARTLAVTNVVGSTAAREADRVFYIRAGPEIGVAATKTFVSQLAALTLLGARLVNDTGGVPLDSSVFETMTALPETLETVLGSSDAATLARQYHRSSAFFFIGRGLAYPVALEGALKLKEISYEHAEGFPAGELKHGPLALVTPDTPVIALFEGPDDTQTLSNVQEIKTREAPVVGIVPDSATEIAMTVDDVLPIPETHPYLAGVPATAQLQLFAYHVADLLDRPIDKPRNLAKSVTVE